MSEYRHLFFALPLPLSAPALNARLAGMAIMQIEEGLPPETAFNRKLLLCKYAPHAPLSPIHLFQQNIDPFNLQHGDNALKFYMKVENDLKPRHDNDILITFAQRHMQVLNAMAVQNFFMPDIISKFRHVIDLKTALETCYFFGNTKCKNLRNLNKAAKELGFSGNLESQVVRLDAMWHIYDYLQHHDAKILAFLMRPLRERLSSLEQSPYFVFIDEKSKLALIKVLAYDKYHGVIKAIKANATELSLIYINVMNNPLIAPTSILTSERQQDLNFDLDKMHQRIASVNLSDLIAVAEGAAASSDGCVCESELDPYFIPQNKLPFVLEFLNSLNDSEREAFSRYETHDIRVRQSQEEIYTIGSKLSRFVLCYLNENFPAAIMESQRQQYEHLISSNIEKRISVMAQECKTLEHNLKEDDTKGAALLARIVNYIS